LCGANIASYAYLSHTCGDLFDFDSKCTTVCPTYYRDVLLFVCGGAAALGLVVLATLAPFQIGTRRRGKWVAGLTDGGHYKCWGKTITVLI